MSTSYESRLGTAPEEGMKSPCVVAAISNITLSAPQTINSISVVAGDRVLVTAQSDATENGIYDVAAAAWSRATDWNDAQDVITGQLCSVPSSIWAATFSGTFAPGTTSVTFTDLLLFLPLAGGAVTGAVTMASTLGVTGKLTMSEDIVFDTSGDGIDFSATADGVTKTSEVFNDYEEGTFTATIADDSGDGTGEGQTYSSQSGRYVKVGRYVHFDLNLSVTSLGTLTTSQAVRVYGLPFTSSSAPATTAGGVHCGFATSLAIAAGTNVTGTIDDGVAWIGLTLWDATAGISPMLLSEFTGLGIIRLAGSYEV